jgi:hypothetical protein
VAKKEVSIIYCPTMVADYFTKPLQGALFYKFRDQILGVVPMDDFNADHRSVLDDKVSPRTTISPKRINSRVAKTKKINVERRQTMKSALAPKDHPSWTDVVRKGKWSVRFAEPKPLKQ